MKIAASVLFATLALAHGAEVSEMLQWYDGQHYYATQIGIKEANSCLGSVVFSKEDAEHIMKWNLDEDNQHGEGGGYLRGWEHFTKLGEGGVNGHEVHLTSDGIKHGFSAGVAGTILHVGSNAFGWSKNNGWSFEYHPAEDRIAWLMRDMEKSNIDAWTSIGTDVADQNLNARDARLDNLARSIHMMQDAASPAHVKGLFHYGGCLSSQIGGGDSPENGGFLCIPADSLEYIGGNLKNGWYSKDGIRWPSGNRDQVPSGDSLSPQSNINLLPVKNVGNCATKGTLREILVWAAQQTNEALKKTFKFHVQGGGEQTAPFSSIWNAKPDPVVLPNDEYPKFHGHQNFFGETTFTECQPKNSLIQAIQEKTRTTIAIKQLGSTFEQVRGSCCSWRIYDCGWRGCKSGCTKHNVNIHVDQKSYEDFDKVITAIGIEATKMALLWFQNQNF